MKEMSMQFEESEQWEYKVYNPYKKFLIGNKEKKLPHVLPRKKKKNIPSRQISFLFENLSLFIGLDISG
jgi:hypothetical protein